MYTDLNASNILIQVFAAVFTALTIAMASHQVRTRLVRVRSIIRDPKNRRHPTQDNR